MNKIQEVAFGLLYNYSVYWSQGRGEEWLAHCRDHRIEDRTINEMQSINPQRLEEWATHPEKLKQAIEDLPT